MWGLAARSMGLSKVSTAISFWRLTRLKNGLMRMRDTTDSTYLNGSMLALASHSPSLTFNPLALLETTQNVVVSGNFPRWIHCILLEVEDFMGCGDNMAVGDQDATADVVVSWPQDDHHPREFAKLSLSWIQSVGRCWDDVGSAASRSAGTGRGCGIGVRVNVPIKTAVLESCRALDTTWLV